MAKIKDIKAYEILDCRGNPTVSATVILTNNLFASASVPSGASKGTHEAIELRDGDARFAGLGVLSVVANIEKKIKPLLLGAEATDQAKIDAKMIAADGTVDKSNFGANAILAVSLAAAAAGAKSLNLPLFKYIQNIYGESLPIKPVTPLFNVVNGGLHGSGKFSFQEFLLVADPSCPYSEALRMGVELYQQLKTKLRANGLCYAVGDEGGFTPHLAGNVKVLQLLLEVIHQSKYTYGTEVHLALDLAASQFYKNNSYYLSIEQKPYVSSDFIDYLVELKNKFKLYLLEDPLAEDEWTDWSYLTAKIGNNCLVIGDDLLVTNKKRLEKAIRLSACNGVLVKVNQIGTLSEVLTVIKLARKANFKVIISHRSGETNDSFIADLAVGVGADFVKFGAPARGERIAKYNRLLEIYKEASSV